MTKIGNTSSFTITCLHQYFTAVAWGGEVKMSLPHPDMAENGSAATFSIASEFGDTKPAPDVIESLNLLARLTWAVGSKQPVSIEKLPETDDEFRYTVSIKKYSPSPEQLAE